MRRFLLVGLLFSAGCAGLMGPRKRDLAPEKIDPPTLPIPEQKYRARDRLAYPMEDHWTAPRTWADIPAEQYGRLSH